MRLLQLSARGNDPVVLEYKDRTRILFSYEVPVAAFLPDRGYIVTSNNVTLATQMRIDKWLGDNHADVVPQEEIFRVITSRPVVTQDNR